MRGGEMLPTLAIGWQLSFSGEGRGSGHFCEVAGMSIVAAGSLRSAADTINCRQLSGLNKL